MFIEFTKKQTIFSGYKPEGITYPSGAMQQKLMSTFYEDIGIDPSTLAYVEAHSTGTNERISFWSIDFS